MCSGEYSLDELLNALGFQKIKILMGNIDSQYTLPLLSLTVNWQRLWSGFMRRLKTILWSLRGEVI